jgi:hypothetical protein
MRTRNFQPYNLNLDPPTVYDLVVTHRPFLRTESDLNLDRSLTVRKSHRKDQASICVDLPPYSKRFIDLVQSNQRRAQNRTDYLNFAKGHVEEKTKTKNVMKHFFGGGRLSGASQTSKVSLGKYLIRPSDPSSINDQSYLMMQNESSERFFKRLKDNAMTKEQSEMPLLLLDKLPSINKVATRQLNESFTSRPSNAIARDKRADKSGSKIYLSELKGSNEHSFLFNGLAKRNRKKNVSNPVKNQTTTIKIKGKVFKQTQKSNDQKDETINAPFRQMTVLDNLMRPRFLKPSTPNSPLIHFAEGQANNNKKAMAMTSQISIEFKNDDEYKNLILAHSPSPNFCDYSLNLQQQISKSSVNHPKLARFENGYNQIFRKHRLSRSERDLEQEDDEFDENKLTSYQFLNWEIKQQEKKKLKTFLTKSKPSNRKKKVPLAHTTGLAETNVFSQELLDSEEPKSYSRWMELVDALLDVNSLAATPTIGYYSTSPELVDEIFGSESLLTIMEFMMQRVKNDLLAGKKFAFMFRQY